MDSSKYADYANWMTSSARDVLSTVSKKDSIPANDLVLVSFDALSTVSEIHSFAGYIVGAGKRCSCIVYCK